ncbi:hypothetical protein PV326_006513 [Microctonus aethiopoides]|nr:hypothetical protein PV326_006513 [Microctonus aethiopoides]
MEFIYIIDFIILPAKKIDKDNLADVADEKLVDDVDYVVDNFVAVDNDDSKHCFVDYPNNFDCIVVLIMIDVHVADDNNYCTSCDCSYPLQINYQPVDLIKSPL